LMLPPGAPWRSTNRMQLTALSCSTHHSENVRDVGSYRQYESADSFFNASLVVDYLWTCWSLLRWTRQRSLLWFGFVEHWSKLKTPLLAIEFIKWIQILKLISALGAIPGSQL
jgi:hypothetical protein